MVLKYSIAEYECLVDKLNCPCLGDIDKDVDRTPSDNPPALRNILKAYSLLDPETGYT
jgi:hypothetical protein